MSTRARLCAWIAGIGLAVVPSLATAQDRTEREIVDLIVREGPQAAAIRSEVEATRREQLTRLAYPNPGVRYSREGAGFTEFLQVEQLLPIFGVRASLARAGLTATSVAEAERDARLWALRADAARQVAWLVAEQNRLEALASHAGEVERLIEILRTREREGEGSRFDRLRAEQERQDARQAVATASVAVADARAAVSALLPRDTTLGRVAGASAPQQAPLQLATLLQRAAAARAELRALRHAGDRADHEADAARRALLPAPTIFGGLKRADQDTGHANGGVVGLSLALPLFDDGSRQRARWAAERARAEAERAAVEAQVRAEIAGALEALNLRQRALQEDEASGGEELMRIAEVAYREGEVGILELLDAARTVSRARLRSLEIRFSARQAQIALERAVGDVLWP